MRHLDEGARAAIEALPQVWDGLRRKVGDAQASLPPGAGPSLVVDDYSDVYGVFLTRSAGLHFQPVTAGGLPGVVLVVDFVSEDAEVAGAG